MAIGGTLQGEVFVDASFAIALVNSNDQLHDVALESARRIQSSGVRLVTTQAVLLEIGNALAKRRFRDHAVQLLASLQADPNVEIVPLTTVLFDGAVALFRDRQDKEWGLIDCLSFVVMADRGIREAPVLMNTLSRRASGHFCERFDPELPANSAP